MQKEEHNHASEESDSFFSIHVIIIQSNEILICIQLFFTLAFLNEDEEV